MKQLFFTMLLFCIVLSSSAQPCNNKEKLVAELHNISQKPKLFFSDKHLYVIHPMIKKEDREREYKIKGNLSWKGDSCKIVYASYEQTKGPESKSTIQLGETFQFNYPLNTLKIFLAENEFKGWEYSESLELDKQAFSGYISTVVIAGKEKNFEVYLKDNELYAASCGFANAGISHEKEMNESADFWYFEKAGGQLRLTKKFTIEASKSNSVPFLTKTTDNYQY